MNDDGHDGDFASVVWDTPVASDASAPQRDQSATSPSDGGPSSGLARRASGNAASNASTGTSGEQHAPDAAARERDAQNAGRYWIKLSAGEPTKMLEGTKDAYVSYNVKGEVRCIQSYRSEVQLTIIDQDQPAPVLSADFQLKKTLSGFCLSP